MQSSENALRLIALYWGDAGDDPGLAVHFDFRRQLVAHHHCALSHPNTRENVRSRERSG